MNEILTTATYWDNIPESTKAYWNHVATRCRHVICTHRPSLRQYTGDTTVRRCSTKGFHGKSADFVRLNLTKLMESGFVFRQYIPLSRRISEKIALTYNNDNH
jgi:hypothetical protein